MVLIVYPPCHFLFVTEVIVCIPIPIYPQPNLPGTLCFSREKSLSQFGILTELGTGACELDFCASPKRYFLDPSLNIMTPPLRKITVAVSWHEEDVQNNLMI